MVLKRFLSVSVFAVLLAASARADLVGTTVTGQMHVGGFASNFFDPASTFVPASGFLNSGTSPTVVISNSAIEFGFDDNLNADRADFTGSTLTLTDISKGNSISVVYSFTDAAFAGLNISEISDNFLAGGVNFSLSGSTITLTAPVFTGAGTFTAVYSLTSASVPEPGSVTLLAGALGIAAFAARRKSRRSLLAK